MSKSSVDAEGYLKWLSEVSQEWESSSKTGNPRAKTTPHGVYQLEEADEINAKCTAICKKIESLESKRGETTAKSFVDQACGICDTLSHLTSNFPTILALREVLNADVNYIMAIWKPNAYGILVGGTIQTLVCLGITMREHPKSHCNPSNNLNPVSNNHHYNNISNHHNFNLNSSLHHCRECFSRCCMQ